MAPADKTPQLDLSFAVIRGATRIARRRVRYPYTFLQPFWLGDQPQGLATVILQSASGGIFGGERLCQSITLSKGAAVHLTNQAATIVHAARRLPAAHQDIHLTLDFGAYLEYLPESMTLFPDADLVQQVRIKIAETAVVLYGDGIVRHDPDQKDRSFRHYRNDVEFYLPDGSLLFGEHAEATGAEFDQALTVDSENWSACGFLAVAAPTHKMPELGLQAAIEKLIDELNQQHGQRIYAATGFLPNDAGLMCRIVAQNGKLLRDTLEACWRCARLHLTGMPAPRRRK